MVNQTTESIIDSNTVRQSGIVRAFQTSLKERAWAHAAGHCAGDGLEQGIPVLAPIHIATKWCKKNGHFRLGAMIQRFARGGHSILGRQNGGCLRCGCPNETMLHRYKFCPANQEVDAEG